MTPMVLKVYYLDSKNVPHLSPFEDSCERYESDVKITNHGNSLVVNLTEGCRRLDIDKGDFVHISVRKI